MQRGSGDAAPFCFSRTIGARVQIGMRLFIATTFPAEVLRAVNERVSKIKTKLPPASWVRPESQHLTLAFLGDHKNEVVEPLSRSVTESLEGSTPFEARLRGCGFFPNPRHARVGWVGVVPEESFRAIAERVRSAVKDAGVALDGSDFKPHLTLMRMRDRWPPACIDTFHKGLGSFESEPFPVEKVTLYSSELNPKGAVHTPVREFRLG